MERRIRESRAHLIVISSNEGEIKMATIRIDLPEELLAAASIDDEASSSLSPSVEVAKLLALELFREGTVSLGRAAELCGVSQAEFMDFAAGRQVPLHYTTDDFDEDRQLIKGL